HLAEPVGQDLELLGPAKGGVQVEVDLGQHVVKEEVLELLFVADMVVQGAGRRMVRAWAPSWAMPANASSPTRSRVSWGRRSWSSVGAPNHSEGDRPWVAPDAGVAARM